MAVISENSTNRRLACSHTIKYFTLAQIALLMFVVAMMYMVMDTAMDRQYYLHIFSQPFDWERIETGFKYYALALKSIGLSPDFSILLTCGLIYFFLARFWFFYSKIQWLESILLFNFFTFSLFQYYLGTSIRMGLATSLALYSFMKLSERKVLYLPFLIVSPFIHYGAIPFVLTVVWVYATRWMAWRMHLILILAATLLFSVVVYKILHGFAFGNYYMQYFNSEFGDTGRFFPLTGLFYWLALFFIWFKSTDSLLRRVVFYGLPALIYGSLDSAGAPLFFKMLMPCIFVSAVLLANIYEENYKKIISPEFRAYMLFVLNVLAFTYALNNYQYI